MANVYRISFFNQGKIYELYAESVHQSEMYGFIVVEGLLFDHHQTLLIDPSEEKLRDEFKGVSRTLPCTPSSGSMRWSRRARTRSSIRMARATSPPSRPISIRRDATGIPERHRAPHLDLHSTRAGHLR